MTRGTWRPSTVVALIGALLVSGGCARKPDREPVVVIGLDGATWTLLQPWIDAGDLPALARVQREWAWGELQTVMPYLSPAAWTSAVTGVNPGKHGIFDFQRRVPGDVAIVNENAKSRRAQPIWNVLSAGGLRSLIFNIPMTDPPDALNGLMVAGFPHPDQVGFAYPPELESELGDYPLDALEMRLEEGREDSLLAETIRVMELRGRLILDWLRNEPFDLLWAVFTCTDRAQHLFWQFQDPQNPNHKPESARRYAGAIRDFWVRMDAMLAEILAAVPPDARVILLSDHGFGPLRYDAHLPEYLRRAGGSLSGNEAKMVQSLDQGDACRLYIARKGRDPGAPFTHAEAMRIRERLIRELERWVDPATSSRVCERIWTSEELFSGTYAEKGPDVVVLPSEGYLLVARPGPMNDGCVGPHGSQLSGWHRMNGIYAARGSAIAPGRRDGEENRAYNLLDVVPTVLYLLGEPVPAGLDGKLMRAVIDRTYLESHPLESGPMLEEDSREMTPEELRNLKNLPYIGD